VSGSRRGILLVAQKLLAKDFYIGTEPPWHARGRGRVNDTCSSFAKKHNVKYFAANECYYLEKEEAHAHDVLLA